MLTLSSFNVNSPSVERSIRQVVWLDAAGGDILVLSELKPGRATDETLRRFERAGYYVVIPPEAAETDYAVAIVARVEVEPETMPASLGQARGRAVSALVSTADGPLRVVGVYGFASNPTGANPFAKVQRKRAWLSELSTAVHDLDKNVPTVLVGDMNIVEPLPLPQYSAMPSFESAFYRSLLTLGYRDVVAAHVPKVEDRVSWRSHSGIGYRFDHLFASPSLAARVTACRMDHTTREGTERLTDHSTIHAAWSSVEPSVRRTTHSELLTESGMAPTLF